MHRSSPDDSFRNPHAPGSPDDSPATPADWSPENSSPAKDYPTEERLLGQAADYVSGDANSPFAAELPAELAAKSHAPANSLSPREASLPTSELRARREAEASAAHKTSARLLWLFAILALFVLVRFNLGPIVEEVKYALTRGHQRAEADHARTQLQMNLSDASEAFRLVYKAVSPSVVHIDVTARLAQNRRGGFGPQVAAGQGSGVILDEEGYILTNNHVIEGAQSIRVRLSDGRTTDATVVGYDEPTDLAVLKIEATGLIASPWGKSENLQVGDWVVAVGNPFGLDRSLTAGIVSAKRRDRVVQDMTYQSFLQTDAAVNPGNSGGPLVNLDGEVVGITTAIVGQKYQGISLAIPSKIARHIYQRLKENGKVERGWLGIRMDNVPVETARSRNIPAAGALVVEVVGDPAETAGLRVGDIITKWNDSEIHDSQDLMIKVAETEVASTANLEVIRQDEEPIKLQVTVEQRRVFD